MLPVGYLFKSTLYYFLVFNCMLFSTPLTSILVKVFMKEHGKYIEITNENKVNRCETYTHVSLWIGTKHWITTCLMFELRYVSVTKSFICSLWILWRYTYHKGFSSYNITSTQKNNFISRCIVGVLPLRLGPKNCFWKTVIRKMWNMCQFAGAEVKSRMLQACRTRTPYHNTSFK
jgi:hypothetical protein